MTVCWTSKIDRYWKEEKENEVKYDSEADILLFVLRDDPPVDAIEESGG
ncbi:MAG: hypothetical protein MRJ65_10905 [Candidatus Brocadiaceae bacterium]|nr:hypothetical protein [Candidatus Brocadiaceae bacterium]